MRFGHLRALGLRKTTVGATPLCEFFIQNILPTLVLSAYPCSPYYQVPVVVPAITGEILPDTAQSIHGHLPRHDQRTAVIGWCSKRPDFPQSSSTRSPRRYPAEFPQSLTFPGIPVLKHLAHSVSEDGSVIQSGHISFYTASSRMMSWASFITGSPSRNIAIL